MRHESNTKSDEILLFGAARYELRNGQITGSNGEVAHLRHQSAAVLAVLATQPGEVVTKETLIDTVWPGVATTDDSLIQCIADIRRTLGRDAVETFPKTGYRLRPTGTVGTENPVNGSRKTSWIVAAGLVIALAAAAAMLAGSMWPVSDPPAIPNEAAMVLPDVLPERTLAVLPFVNLNADQSLRFFSDGLSEDLTTDLSKVPRLTVVSHASSFDFPDAELGFEAIAKDLGVRYLVRGTVRHEGERVRINASLVDPFAGHTLWSERYDRERRNSLDVQEDVTREITRALSLKLGAPERVPQRVEPDAYFMLLKGLEPLRKLSAAGNEEARQYFQRALELDPEYARAHANIAVTYGRETLHQYANNVEQESIETGLEAAVSAIQLDPDIPHAYYALGVLNLAIGEHDNALAAARHAISIDGNYADGYALLAEVGVLGGDLEEALIAIRRAKRLHPHHAFSYHWIEGHVLFQMGRHGEAQPFLEAAVEDNADFIQGPILLAANLGQRGSSAEAENALETAQRLRPDLDVETALSLLPYRFEDRRNNLRDGLTPNGLPK